MFVDLAYADSDRDATARQSGFDADSWLVRAGLEYDYSQDGFVGGALSYTRTDASLDASGGTVETDDYQVFAYGTRYLNAAWHIDGSLGFSDAKMDTERAVRYQIAAVGGGVTSVDQLALSDTNASTLWADVMLGYDINRPGWIAMPYAKLQIARVKIDGFTERMSKPGEAGSGLATQIDDQGITSVPVALGVTAAFPTRTRYGELIPQLIGEVVFELDNKADDITGRFVQDPTGTSFVLPTDDPDRFYGRVGAGATLAFSNATSASVVYQGLVGFSHLDLHAFQVSFRHRW